MSNLPLEHKRLIQESYVRFRELISETKSVTTLMKIGQAARWGGLAVVLVGLVRMVVGRDELPITLQSVALLTFLCGWAYESDHRKKRGSLWDERQTINQKMEAIGVSFNDYGERVTAHCGQTQVDPLLDSSYSQTVEPQP